MSICDQYSVPERGRAWLVRRGEGVGDVRGCAGLKILQQPSHGYTKPAWCHRTFSLTQDVSTLICISYGGKALRSIDHAKLI